MNRRAFLQALAASGAAVALAGIPTVAPAPIPIGTLLRRGAYPHAAVYLRARGHVRPGDLVVWVDDDTVAPLTTAGGDDVGIASDLDHAPAACWVQIYGPATASIA